ncbi:hypothetical protein Tco_0934954 [Tanacetum coccineum]
MNAVIRQYPTYLSGSRQSPILVATKPYSALKKPPSCLAAAAAELSPTSYLGPSARPNPIRGGRLTSGLSSLCSDGNEVGAYWHGVVQICPGGGKSMRLVVSSE